MIVHIKIWSVQLSHTFYKLFG